MPKPYTQTGLGMVDFIIGLVISLMVAFTAYGSLIFFQNYQRSGINSNSAVENGISSLFAIEHDIKVAGLGFLANGSTPCSGLNISYGGNVYATNAPAAPVIITNGGTGPDSVSVMYANSVLAAAPAISLAATNSSSGSITVNSAQTLQTNSVALISSLTNLPCTIVLITQIQDNGSNSQISFDEGSSPSTAYPSGSFVSGLGGFTWNTWRVNNGKLEVTNNLNGNVITIADNIVQMQAQYGVTNGTSTSIQQWVDATGQWANLDNTEIARILAVRIAIVARSPQREKPSSGNTCDTTTQAPLPWPGGTPISLAADPNWQCYRYKVFKAVIPLRNIVMGGIS